MGHMLVILDIIHVLQTRHCLFSHRSLSSGESYSQQSLGKKDPTPGINVLPLRSHIVWSSLVDIIQYITVSRHGLLQKCNVRAKRVREQQRMLTVTDN